MLLASSIYTNYPKNNGCPCGSNKKAKVCCLKGGSWNKKPSRIIPIGQQSNIENDKCYAAATLNCCDKISREHYISENILKIVNDGRKSVPIEGLTWIPKGESRSIGTSSLVSNILCKRHNVALSPLDSEAGKLIRTIGDYDKDFNNANPKEEIKILCGEDIERWMLKTACGLVSSGHLGKDNIPLTAEVKDIWIEILYGIKAWPANWGLYMSTPIAGTIVQHSKLFGFMPITHPNTGELIAAELLINNFKFYLCLGNFSSFTSFGIHRPKLLIFRQNNVTKYIDLSWQNKSFDKYVLFDRGGTYDGEPTIIG